jgi:hypothetical protein
MAGSPRSRRLVRASRSSVQGFASGFLPTPPRDDAVASGSGLASPLQALAHAGRTTRRNAARSSHRAPRAASGVGAGTPHGHHARPGGASLRRPSRGSCGLPRGNASRSSIGTSAGGGANCDRKARAAGECRRGGAGAGIGRASARCLATDRGGRSPPESKPAAERLAAKLNRRQNSHASPPAAELPRISTGGRTAGHPHRRQNSRASPPAAEPPCIPTQRPAPQPPMTGYRFRSATTRSAEARTAAVDTLPAATAPRMASTAWAS